MSIAHVFAFDTRAVRVQLDEHNNPWFNANDVCAALELANPHKSIADHVDDDDRTKRDVIDALGRSQLTNHINESGLYSLILGSTKPAAKKFKKWVTGEVLPSIRKTGRYQAPGAARRDDPLSIDHRADIFVGADRVFRAAVRAGRSAGMTTAAAIRRAQHITLDRTGIDMLDELNIPAPADPPPPPDRDEIIGARRFCDEWVSGRIPLPYTVCRRSDLYRAYIAWCQQPSDEEAPITPVSHAKFNHQICQHAHCVAAHGNVMINGARVTARLWVPKCQQAERRKYDIRAFDTYECQRFAKASAAFIGA